MSNYSAVAAMAGSLSLRDRVAACAAQEGKSNPVIWAQEHMWAIAASPSWDETWQYAVDTYNVNQNPDTGSRTDVISDAMILTAVQGTV